jgi:DnaK suppressor protein
MNDTTQYKIKLEAELRELEKELSNLGVLNPIVASAWDVKAPDFDIMNADENEVADRVEEMHVDSLIIDELSVRLKNVKHALKKIEEGVFGLCEIDGGPIEADRLQANPAARTCKEHIDLEETLEK